MAESIDAVVDRLTEEVYDDILDAFEAVSDGSTPITLAISISLLNSETKSIRKFDIVRMLKGDLVSLNDDIDDENFGGLFDGDRYNEPLQEAACGYGETDNEQAAYTASDFERAVRDSEQRVAEAGGPDCSDTCNGCDTDCGTEPRIEKRVMFPGGEPETTAYNPFAGSFPRIFDPPEQTLDLCGLSAVILFDGDEKTVIENPLRIVTKFGDEYGMRIETAEAHFGPGRKLGWSGGTVMTCIPGLTSQPPFFPEQCAWIEFPPHDRSYSFAKFGRTFQVKDACAIALCECDVFGRLEAVRDTNGLVTILPGGAKHV